MNYAERCRALAKKRRESSTAWKELANLGSPHAEATSKIQADHTALLDAAAVLYETVKNASVEENPDVIALADAAAKGAE